MGEEKLADSLGRHSNSLRIGNEFFPFYGGNCLNTGEDCACWRHYSLPARKSSFFIHGQGVDVVQEVANLFGKQWWQALSEVQFDASQKRRFFSGKGVRRK